VRVRALRVVVVVVVVVFPSRTRTILGAHTTKKVTTFRPTNQRICPNLVGKDDADDGRVRIVVDSELDRLFFS